MIQIENKFNIGDYVKYKRYSPYDNSYREDEGYVVGYEYIQHIELKDPEGNSVPSIFRCGIMSASHYEAWKECPYSTYPLTWAEEKDIELTEHVELTSVQKFNRYVDWLEENDFGSRIMNEVANEIARSMTSLYVHGSTYEKYDENGEYLGVFKFELDHDNPNTKEILDFCVEGLKKDDDYLKELGIVKKKSQINKKHPYLFSDIEWSLLYKF